MSLDATDPFREMLTIGDDLSPYRMINVFMPGPIKFEDPDVGAFDPGTAQVPIKPDVSIIAPWWNAYVTEIYIELGLHTENFGHNYFEIETDQLNIVEDPTLKEGFVIRIDMGMSTPRLGPTQGPVFFGRIREVEPEFSGNKVVVKVSCDNYGVDLRNQHFIHFFDDGISSGEAIRGIISQYGMALAIPSKTPALRHRMGAGSAIEICMRIAEDVGWHFWVQDGVAYFQPEEHLKPAITTLYFGGMYPNVYKVRVKKDPAASAITSMSNVDDHNGDVVQAVTTEPKIRIEPATGAPPGNPKERPTMELPQLTKDNFGPQRSVNIRDLMDKYTKEKIEQAQRDSNRNSPAPEQAIMQLLDPRNNHYHAEAAPAVPDSSEFVIGKYQEPTDTFMTYSQRKLWRVLQQHKAEHDVLHTDPSGSGVLRPASGFQWPAEGHLQRIQEDNLPTTQQEAKETAEAMSDLTHFPYTIEIESIGDWVLRQADKLQLRGVCHSYDGEWFIEQVVHHFDKHGKYINRIRGHRRASGSPTEPITAETWKVFVAEQEAERKKEWDKRHKAIVLEVVHDELAHFDELLKEYTLELNIDLPDPRTQVIRSVDPVTGAIQETPLSLQQIQDSKLEAMGFRRIPDDRNAGTSQYVSTDPNAESALELKGDFPAPGSEALTPGSSIAKPTLAQRDVLESGGHLSRHFFAPGTVDARMRTKGYVVVAFNTPNTPDVLRRSNIYLMKEDDVVHFEAMIDQIKKSTSEVPVTLAEVEAQK